MRRKGRFASIVEWGCLGELKCIPNNALEPPLRGFLKGGPSGYTAWR